MGFMSMTDMVTHVLVKMVSKKFVVGLATMWMLAHAGRADLAAGVAVVYLAGQSYIDARVPGDVVAEDEDEEIESSTTWGFSAPVHDEEEA